MLKDAIFVLAAAGLLVIAVHVTEQKRRRFYEVLLDKERGFERAGSY